MHGNSISDTHNFGQIIQIRDVHNNHVTYTTNSNAPHPLHVALLDAVVDLGDRKGVRVAPDLVLTHGDTRPELRTSAGDGPYACVGVDQAEPTLLLKVDDSPGAPVLNWRTGAVCGVLDARGRVQALTETGALAEVSRANTAWLDLLERDQIAAGGWRHLPRALRRYLEPIADADRRHDYPLARHAVPPLAEIHLKRKASRQDAEDDEAEPIPADRLTAHRDAQVVAVPGAGKSSLVRTIAAESARRWLEHGTGEFVPVPVTADAFTGRRSLPDALAEAVAGAFSVKLGGGDLVRLLGEEPLPGVPWLVLVDGLDEVSAPDVREKVVHRISEFRKDAAYRFLVTSRPLNPHELVPLIDRQTSPTYVLELFSDADLRAFVVRYLTAQDHPDPEGSADDLLARVARTNGLARLVHVPLFATMLCILHTESDGGELPVDQTELYRRFVDLQLSKLHAPEAMAALRGRVAGWGPEAEAAVVRFAAGLTDALEDAAHAALVRGVDVELSELLRRRLGPAAVTERVWEEGLGEVLRLSGLLVQSGRHFDYPHKTFQEYFAAARLARDHDRPTVRRLFPLAGRRDSQVGVFLAARWWKDDHDLGPVLRTLLRWPYTARNVGFLADLVNHGVPLPEKVRDKASRWLEATLGRTAGGAAWQERARWFHDIDPAGAGAALRRMVLDRLKGEDRRFEALRSLIDVAPADVVDLALDFLTDRRVGARPKLTVGSLLHRRDPAAGLALAEALADHDDGEARYLALQFLAPHAPERALEVARRIVTDTGMTDDQRFSAAREAAKLDHARGTDLMCDVIRLAASDQVREAAMEAVRAIDQARLAALCEELSADRTGNPDLRFTTTMYLVKRLGRPTSLLTDLVAGRDFPPEKRVKAALVDRGSAAKRILEDVVESFDEHDGKRLWAIEQLMLVAAREAASYLAALVRDERQKPPKRLQAVMLISKHVPLAELMQLFAVLVRSPSLSDDDRLTAARKAMTVERGEGKKLVVSIAEDPAVAKDLRMKAAAALGKAGERQAEFLAYRAIALDGALLDAFRVKAAVAARRASRSEGDELIGRLARTEMRGKARMELIDALTGRAKSVLLEQVAEDGGEASELRFAAAKRLLAAEPALGRRVMGRLADDRKMPDRLRGQAREASA